MSSSSTSTALAPIESDESAPLQQYMPAMPIEQAVERYNMITEFVSRVLHKDVDYGIIPGSDKQTLLKPGAEKLTTFFGLSTRFEIIERIEDWSGDAHAGEPFFYYLYRCSLWRGDQLIAEADGSCNSRETKYRWRQGERVCPSCNQAAIIKGKEGFGGGWLCFRKKGGCGAKFATGDAAIEGQQVGRVPNPDICDLVNTIQKMGTKRSLVAATLLAVNASEFFTQDAEDFGFDHPSTGIRNVTPAALPRDIKEACEALGRTEGQLNDWLQRKYGAANYFALKSQQQQEVSRYLKAQVDKAAAGSQAIQPPVPVEQSAATDGGDF